MLITDLDNRIHQWKIKGFEIVEDRRQRSSLHIEARRLLKLRFPTAKILEEVPFKPRQGQTLYFDFFIPLLKIAVEVHGEQHFKFNSLFHASASDFIQQRKNDSDKQEWCELNDIELIILRYDETDKWETILL